ncbi:MAG: class I SAM-dependent methyltransferase [Spirochaetota bacterium]
MKCRLCGNQNLTLYYTQGNTGQYKYYKCHECKLVNYDMSGGLDQKKYSAMKYVSPEDDLHKMNTDQKAAYKFIRGKIKQRGRLLDIGCGNGKLLLLAENDGWNVKGIELSESLAGTITARYGIEVKVSDFLEYMPEQNQLFDIIVLRHVLEHLPDPVAAMKKIHSLLKPDGVSFLEFPDIEGCEQKIKRLLKKARFHKTIYYSEYKPGHCNEFCRKSFEFLLMQTGFTLSEWCHYSSRSYFNLLYNFSGLGTKVRALIKKNNDVNAVSI